jgi:hypothetical protein
MRPEILSYDNGSEGLSDEAHLFQAEVLPDGLQIANEMRGSQQRRVGELGTPAASLIIEDDDAVLSEWLEIRTDVIDACAGPTMNHDDRVVARSDHLVEDLSPTRTSQITLGRCSLCRLAFATNRRRNHKEQSAGGVR